MKKLTYIEVSKEEYLIFKQNNPSEFDSVEVDNKYYINKKDD